MQWTETWSNFEKFYLLFKSLDSILFSLILKLIVSTIFGQNLKVSWCKVSAI